MACKASASMETLRVSHCRDLNQRAVDALMEAAARAPRLATLQASADRCDLQAALDAVLVAKLARTAILAVLGAAAASRLRGSACCAMSTLVQRDGDHAVLAHVLKYLLVGAGPSQE